MENKNYMDDEEVILEEEQFYKNFSKTSFSIFKALVLMLVLTTLFALIIGAISDEIDNKILLMSSLTTTLTYIICYFVFLKKDTYPLGWEKKDSSLKWLLLGIGLMTIANIGISLISYYINSNLDTESIDAAFLSSGSMFVDILTIGILPGLGEELLFRGIVHRYLRKYDAKIAIVGSALIFALAHMNLTQGIFAFFAGAILSITYEKTGSLLVPILIHILNNSMAVLGLTYPMVEIIMYLLVIFALGYIISAFIRRKMSGQRIEGKKFDKKLFKHFIFNPGILVYEIYCIISIIFLMINGII